MNFYDNEVLEELILHVKLMLEYNHKDKQYAYKLLPIALKDLHDLLRTYPLLVIWYCEIKQDGLALAEKTHQSKQRDVVALKAIQAIIDAYENLAQILDGSDYSLDILLVGYGLSLKEKDLTLLEAQEKFNESIARSLECWRRMRSRQEVFFDLVKMIPSIRTIPRHLMLLSVVYLWEKYTGRALKFI